MSPRATDLAWPRSRAWRPRLRICRVECSIGLLSRVFPPELVDEVIEEAGAREQRRRLLPSRLMAYFCLACWLYMNQGYDGVLRPWSTGCVTPRRAGGSGRCRSPRRSARRATGSDLR